MDSVWHYIYKALVILRSFFIASDFYWQSWSSLFLQMSGPHFRVMCKFFCRSLASAFPICVSCDLHVYPCVSASSHFITHLSSPRSHRRKQVKMRYVASSSISRMSPLLLVLTEQGTGLINFSSGKRKHILFMFLRGLSPSSVYETTQSWGISSARPSNAAPDWSDVKCPCRLKI